MYVHGICELCGTVSPLPPAQGQPFPECLAPAAACLAAADSLSLQSVEQGTLGSRVSLSGKRARRQGAGHLFCWLEEEMPDIQKREYFSLMQEQFSGNEFDIDVYAEYAEEFDPDFRADAKLVRRPPKSNFVPKVPHHQRHWAKIAEEQRRGITGDFETTYQPGHTERRWLLATLRPFFETDHIDDVLSKVKGGKEADVYRCSLTERGQRQIVAAKLYRPRSHRTMRNDLIYREGRNVLTPQGQTSRAYDRRVLRAMLKRTEYGKQAEQTSWLMHEYHALVELHAAGADVPEPIETAPNAILMEFIGDEHEVAPVLHSVHLGKAEAQVLFEQVLRNLQIMLEAGLIHGDLSAHNILYWGGRAILIDFPQVVPVAGNKQAFALLTRDVVRICQYWRKQGVKTDPEQLAQDLWGSYSQVRHEDVLADLSAALATETDDEAQEEEDPD